MISPSQIEILLDTLRHPKDHIIGWWGRFVRRDGSTHHDAIWLRNGWRLMEKGEVVKPGDEFLAFNCAVGAIWRKACAGGHPWMISHTDMPTVRRRIA